MMMPAESARERESARATERERERERERESRDTHCMRRPRLGNHKLPMRLTTNGLSA